MPRPVLAASLSSSFVTAVVLSAGVSDEPFVCSLELLSSEDPSPVDSPGASLDPSLDASLDASEEESDAELLSEEAALPESSDEAAELASLDPSELPELASLELSELPELAALEAFEACSRCC